MHYRSLNLSKLVAATLALVVVGVHAQKACPASIWMSCKYKLLPTTTSPVPTLFLSGIAATPIAYACNGQDRGAVLNGDLSATLRVPKIVTAATKTTQASVDANAVSVIIIDDKGETVGSFESPKTSLAATMDAAALLWTGPTLCVQGRPATIDAYFGMSTSEDEMKLVSKACAAQSDKKNTQTLAILNLDETSKKYTRVSAIAGLRFGYQGTDAATTKLYIGAQTGTAETFTIATQDPNSDCSCFKYPSSANPSVSHTACFRKDSAKVNGVAVAKTSVIADTFNSATFLSDALNPVDPTLGTFGGASFFL